MTLRYSPPCAVCGLTALTHAYLAVGPMPVMCWSLDPWIAEPVCVRCSAWKDGIFLGEPVGHLIGQQAVYRVDKR